MKLPKVLSDSVPSRSRDLDYLADDGNDEGGGYSPGIQVKQVEGGDGGSAGEK